PMAAREGQSDPHRREPGQRRPMCAVCTKPLSVCLCGRLRGPPLDTTVGVTVLQHTMEVRHPLSSIRVARLGLRNLAVTQVTDVNHRASFLLRTLGGATASNLADGETDVGASLAGNHDGSVVPGQTGLQDGDDFERSQGKGLNHAKCSDSEDMGINPFGVHLGEENATVAISRQAGGEGLDNGEISNCVFSDLDREVGGGIECDSNGGECFRFDKAKSNEHAEDFERPVSAANQSESYVANAANAEGQQRSETCVTNKVHADLPHPLVETTSVNGICTENVEVGAATGEGWTVENMDKCSVAYTEKELRIDIERGVKPKIRWLCRGSVGQGAVSNGFTVTKIQKNKSRRTGEVSEFEEFSITIPPHAALLFPCQGAISLDALDCQVKHLIVLDGTWAKAQRMYHENPWLQLLPHVKLESDKVSLYSEVRQEPKAGCLSTIESIVITMKKLGEDEMGLDDVLSVFESMIIDQRRCKEENWKPKLKP
uniref:tRNA-uridine aminocarboxypropyltransferase n=3 Tax=Aegilops tauschii TaxID=37682 RepID=A0A453CYP6_AEGTS